MTNLGIVLTVDELYDAMCRYLRANGWTRENEGSGWWWKPDAEDGETTVGYAVEQQLHEDGVDTRVMRIWEPYEFWPDEDDEATA